MSEPETYETYVLDTYVCVENFYTPKNQINLPPNFYQYTGSPQPERADITTIALNIICY